MAKKDKQLDLSERNDLEADAIASASFVEEFNTKPEWDEDGVQATAGIGKDGKEYGDPTPLEPPIGFDRPPDLMETMRQMIRNEAYQFKLSQEGFDTFEEAGDFDIEEDPMPLTLHEALLMQQPEAASPPAAPSAPSSPQSTEVKQGGQGGGSPDTPPRRAPL